MPAHPGAEAYVDAYLAPGPPRRRSLPPLPHGSRKTELLTDQRLNRKKALAIIKRRLKTAGLPTNICNHTFRATGHAEALTAIAVRTGNQELCLHLGGCFFDRLPIASRSRSASAFTPPLSGKARPHSAGVTSRASCH